MRFKNGRSGVCLTLFVVSSLAGSAARARVGGPDRELAAAYFREARELCERDAGRLWGVSLCGPLILVDAETRAVVASHADAEGRLTREGGVFAGRLPPEVNAANTATAWAGVRWTMMLWPLPRDRAARAQLMMHELFHRVQDKAGVPAANPSNNQLDTRDGRLWLQSEWRALRAALVESGERRRRAVADALLFRAHRRALFPRSAAAENALELNEGLAEYTGARLTAPDDRALAAAAARGIDEAPARPSFVRSFAYVSGPTYGALLDATRPGWRKGLGAQSDLGALLQTALAIRLPRGVKARAEERLAAYDCTSLRAAEDAREEARTRRLVGYRARLVVGPTLLLPLTEKMSYSFDPNRLVPLDDASTVYPTLRIVDEWGILEVEGGALLTRGARPGVTVPAPADAAARPLKGDGWTLQLKEGWRVEPGRRAGDYVVTKTAGRPR